MMHKKLLTKCISMLLTCCLVGITILAIPSFEIISNAEGTTSLVHMQDFEDVNEGNWDKVFSVGGNQEARITTENPLHKQKSLLLKNNSAATATGANGLFVSIEESFGRNNIALRVKRNNTSDGIFRIVANTLANGTAHQNYTEISKVNASAYYADGTEAVEISYNDAWDGYEIPANFDGYIFIENTENADITSLSLGMAHNSFPANIDLEITLDCIASYVGNDYSVLINMLNGIGNDQSPEEDVNITSILYMQDFEDVSEGNWDKVFSVGGNQLVQITTENPLHKEKSLLLKNNSAATATGANGLFVSIEESFGRNNIALRVKRNNTSDGIFRIVANTLANGTAHQNYTEISKVNASAYYADGTEAVEISYNDAWDGYEIPANFDGYIFIKNTENVDITSLSLGMAHNSYPANTEIQIMLDCIAAYTGNDFVSLIEYIDEMNRVGGIEVIENFETIYEGDYNDKWEIGGNQSVEITTTDTLLGNNSLIMKNNSDTGYNGANGIYATVTKAFGTNGIVVRLKRNNTQGGAFRFVANSTQFAHQGFTKFSTVSPIAYNLDGTINNGIIYDTAWEGLNIPANFDGYIFMPNNEQINITSLSFGMYHNSFPANTNIEIMIDSIAAYYGNNYRQIIQILEEESQGEDMETIAAKITNIKEINYGQKSIIFPSVPGGMNIKIESSSDINVIDLKGTIYPQSEEKEVQLVFQIQNKKTGESALTESINVVVPETFTISNAAQEAFLNLKYGLFVHYVPNLTINSDGTKIIEETVGTRQQKLEAFARAFDVEQFVQDVKDMNMQYVIFTAWHSKMIPLYPSEAMVNHGLSNLQISGYDLLGEIIDSLKAEGIGVFLYTHPRDGHELTEEDAAKVGWAINEGSGDPNFDEFDFEKWNDFINDVYGELIDRYGNKISGLFVDEGSSAADSYRVVDYNRLYKTIKTKNPDLILMHNFYGTTYGLDLGMKEYFNWCEFETAESNRWPSYEIPTAIGISESGWWAGATENVTVCKYNPDDLFRYTVLQSATNTKGGGTAWAAGPYSGGGWEKDIKEYLVRVGALIETIEEGIFNTKPSESFPTKSGSTLGTVDFVANSSLNEQYEYVHVLNAPNNGKTITLGVPTDGKSFATSAEALNDGASFEVITNEETGVVTLQFVGTNSWEQLNSDEKLDYVVKLTVQNQGTATKTYEYINNTDTAIRYLGGSWTYERWYRHNSYSDNWENTVGGDFEADIIHSLTPGAYFEIPFHGTGITYMPCTNSENTDSCDIYIDDELVATGVSLNSSSYIPQAEVFSKLDLQDGAHVFKVVNTGRGRLVNDVVKIIKNTQ